MTDTLLASTVPTFTVDGQERPELHRDVLRLDVAEDSDGLRTLTLRLLAFGPRAGDEDDALLYLDGSIFDFGRAVKVRAGPPDDEHDIFDGSISAVEADFAETREPQVVVFAEDRLMDLRMTRRTRAYEQMSDAGIAGEIARAHGLSVQAGASGPTYDIVHQWGLSDLSFLRERAAHVHAEIWVEGSTLHFQRREDRSAAALTLVQGNELISAQIRADLAHQRTAVKISGYDASARAAIQQTADSAALSGEAAGGSTGPQTLQRALGDRAYLRVQDMPLVDAEAEEWARSEMLRRGRGFVTVVGVTRGSPGMTVGSELTLERIGGPFPGAGYRVTRVAHSFDPESGLRTHFEAERPTVGSWGP